MAKSKKSKDPIEFLYAGGNIVNLGETPRFVSKKTTNRPSIDYVTDGGFPIGRMILIAGEKSAGKSTLTIQMSDIIGDKILYVDTEATLTTDYIQALGADPAKFSHCIPESTEQLCNIVRNEIPNYDVIIIDSINNSASIEQIQKTAEEKTYANRANVLSSQLPIMIGRCNQYNTTLIILSQIRENMDKKNPYSPDTIIPGGQSLHHNSSMTLEVTPATKKRDSNSDPLNSYDNIYANMVRIKCTKNKVGKPHRTVELEMVYGKGYTIEADIASASYRLGILERAGSWIRYKGNTLVQGVDNLVPMLEDNPELLEELRVEIYKILDNEDK